MVAKMGGSAPDDMGVCSVSGGLISKGSDDHSVSLLSGSFRVGVSLLRSGARAGKHDRPAFSQR